MKGTRRVTACRGRRQPSTTEAATERSFGGRRVSPSERMVKKMAQRYFITNQGIRDTKKRYYIAYGSNLNVEQMRMRCPHATVVGTATLEGWELLFKGSKTGSYLTIEECDGGTVPVAVWEVTEFDEAALDRYEGYPVFYYKKEIRLQVKGIRTGRRRMVTAFVYIMDETRPLGKPMERYVRVCREGYRTFGFDSDILTEAIRKSVTS